MKKLMTVPEFMKRELNDDEKFYYSYVDEHRTFEDDGYHGTEEEAMRIERAVRDESCVIAIDDGKSVVIYDVGCMEDKDATTGYSFNYDNRIIENDGSKLCTGGCYWGYPNLFDLIYDEFNRNVDDLKFYDVSEIYPNIEKMDDNQTYAEFKETIIDFPEMMVEVKEYEA